MKTTLKIQLVGSMVMAIGIILLNWILPLELPMAALSNMSWSKESSSESGFLGISEDIRVQIGEIFIKQTLPMPIISIHEDEQLKTDVMLAAINNTAPLEVKKFIEPSPEPEPPVHQPAPEEPVQKAEVVETSLDTGKTEVALANETAYKVDTQSLLGTQLKFRKTSEPMVLILHTHTSESYTQTPGDTYIETDPYRTEDESKNICRVGQEMANVLKERGIPTLHITKSHDYPSYSGSYSRSMQTAQEAISANPSIQVVIDLHRDSIATSSGAQLKVIADIDGKQTAQALVIVGTDSNGLEHPHWRENLMLGLKLQEKMMKIYKNLARTISLRKERFNGHLSKGALLIEIGTSGNTLSEAVNSARLVGECLAELINEHS